MAKSDGEGAKAALSRYWSIVGFTFVLTLLFGFAGFAFSGFWILAAGLVLLGLPVAQAVGSLVMFVNRDPVVRRAALKVTAAWIAFTLLGAWLTLGWATGWR